MWVDINTVGFGVTCFTCFDKEYSHPMGFAWCIRLGGKDDTHISMISHMYTVPWARRKGVANYILKSIKDDANFIHTGIGSDDGGKEFLEQAGFKFDKRAGIFVLKGNRKSK